MKTVTNCDFGIVSVKETILAGLYLDFAIGNVDYIVELVENKKTITITCDGFIYFKGEVYGTDFIVSHLYRNSYDNVLMTLTEIKKAVIAQIAK